MIVSNTSPLRYLIAVGQADLIQKVFEEVLIPPAVLTELTHPSGRDDVRRWIERRPTWLRVLELQSPPPRELVATLDSGECETIQLALETHLEFILMDERLGRRAATALGLTVIGALGLLRESYRQRYIAEPVPTNNSKIWGQAKLRTHPLSDRESRAIAGGSEPEIAFGCSGVTTRPRWTAATGVALVCT